MVNAQIRANLPVSTRNLPRDEAFSLGAIAPFGEKYGETVRVVRCGDFSMEFCGGTHLNATGEIGVFLVAGESSIASGVRRIEALTGQGAYEAIARDRETLDEICRRLSATSDSAAERVQALQDELKALRRELQRSKEENSASEVDSILAAAPAVQGVKVVAHAFPGLDSAQLRTMADVIRAKAGGPVVAALGSAEEKKVALIVAVSKDLEIKVPAGGLVQEIAKMVGGGGGGRPDMAQAGGKNPEKLPEALAAVAGMVEKRLGA
ncbi:MAG: Alanine--tRNA ligase [candidate division BRC1 bacterium ADurb.BinA364]|nr:MAG: Alanine--tRNA ligase [candidate division BRC1 bacterium ADurb.BinA364]